MTEAKRQLAAIMFTDIVGYTAMMGKDSNKTLELVRQSKKIQIQPTRPLDSIPRQQNAER